MITKRKDHPNDNKKIILMIKKGVTLLMWSLFKLVI